MRLHELLHVLPAGAKVRITVITPTGGVKKGENIDIRDAIELYRMYMSDKVLNVESEYDWDMVYRDDSLSCWDKLDRMSNAIYTGILVTTLWRYSDE